MAAHLPTRQDFPDQVKDIIDAQVSAAGKAIYRNGMEVLASGFGKGVLITVAAVAATFLVGSIVAPGLVFGAESAYAGYTAAQAIGYALPAMGNFLLGTGWGIAILATGGATGSLAAAWSENTRISKEAAMCLADELALARQSAAHGIAPTLAQEINEGCEGHCARLLREQQNRKERGV